MIIDKEKLIFIHIPKNAGTSIKSIFSENKNFHIPGGEIFKHKTINEIKKEHLDKYNEYKKFAIIRNPYDRMISFYAYYKNYRLTNNMLYKKGYVEKANIKNFREWICNKKENVDINYSIKYHVGKLNVLNTFIKEKLFKPQHTWVDKTVAILKFENLQKDFNDFLNKKVNIPKTNNSSRYDLLDYYNEETANIVYNLYKEDFKKFNYKKL